jgi:hypothetical protein
MPILLDLLTRKVRRLLADPFNMKTPAVSYALLTGLNLVEAKLARARARRLASTIPTQTSNLDFVEHLQRRALKKRPDYVSQNIDKVRV